jgi:hypothetical protein
MHYLTVFDVYRPEVGVKPIGKKFYCGCKDPGRRAKAHPPKPPAEPPTPTWEGEGGEDDIGSEYLRYYNYQVQPPPRDENILIETETEREGEGDDEGETSNEEAFTDNEAADDAPDEEALVGTSVQ